MQATANNKRAAELLAREINAPVSEVAKQTYSFKRALMALANGNRSDAGFEQEVDQALRQIHGGCRGFWLPETILRTALGTSANPELMFDAPIDMADPLRPLSVLGRVGAPFELVSGMKAAVIVKQPADGSVAWVGESETVTESNGTTAAITIARKTVRAKSSTTKQLDVMSHSLARADAMELRSLAGAVASEIDRVGINGTGAANEPLGLLNTSGIGSVAINANGGAPTYQHMCELEETVGLANADVSCAFATTPKARRKLRTTEKAAGSGFVWGDDGILGYPSIVSTNIPSNLTKGSGSNLSAILFGDFSQLYVVRFGPLDILTDPYTRGDEGEIVYRVFAGIGVGVRHTEAFAAVTDAVTT